MPSPNRKVVKTYLTEDENREIRKNAAQTRLSLSRYVRVVCKGYEPKSKVDQEAVLALLQVNRDLSRLGNLLKLALDQQPPDKRIVDDLLNQINELKKELIKKVDAI